MLKLSFYGPFPPWSTTTTTTTTTGFQHQIASGEIKKYVMDVHELAENNISKVPPMTVNQFHKRFAESIHGKAISEALAEPLRQAIWKEKEVSRGSY